MRDFFETVRLRHTVRHYQTDMPVEDGKLNAILEMACAAPSAGDLQAYQIIAVTDEQARQQLMQAAENQAFIRQAPVCLVFCADPGRSGEKFGHRGEELYALQDTTIAAAYAQLATAAAGLGSTWVGYFDEQAVGEILDLPASLRPVAMLSIGYPAELPEATPRRPLKALVSIR